MKTFPKANASTLYRRILLAYQGIKLQNKRPVKMCELGAYGFKIRHLKKRDKEFDV